VPCNTTIINDVRWFFESVHGDWCVYEFGRVREAFKSRFSLNTSVPGLYGLDISNVELNDTGNYTCIDDNGQGDHHIRHLTVHGKWPRTSCFIKLYRPNGGFVTTIDGRCNVFTFACLFLSVCLYMTVNLITHLLWTDISETC